MKPIEELKEEIGLSISGIFDPQHKTYKGFVEWPGFRGSVIFGYQEGTEDAKVEHVSVSNYNRRKLPTWEDMCRLKKMFFREDEMAVQIHPSESRYLHGVGGRYGSRDRLENVLHLWRPANGDWSVLNHPEKWD